MQSRNAPEWLETRAIHACASQLRKYRRSAETLRASVFQRHPVVVRPAGSAVRPELVEPALSAAEALDLGNNVLIQRTGTAWHAPAPCRRVGLSGRIFL
jgi:hypothetical protein